MRFFSKNATRHITKEQIILKINSNITPKEKITANTPKVAPISADSTIRTFVVFLCNIIEHINSAKKSILKLIAKRISTYKVTHSHPFKKIISL